MRRGHQRSAPLSPEMIREILSKRAVSVDEEDYKVQPFHVDRDFEVQNNAIRKKLNLTEDERLDRLRQRKLTDPALKCILDLEHRIVHDRDCPYGRDIPKEHFDASETRPQGFKRCRRCFLDLLVRQALENDQYTAQAAAFLRSIGTTADRFLRFMQQNEVRLRYITGRILQIKVNEDTWQIRKVGGRFLLFHNNYVFCGRERRLLNDFHEQKVRASLGFDGYAEIMETYKPAFHIDRIIAEEELEMERAPDNFILPENIFQQPTAVRLEKTGLIFVKYIIIDGKECFYKKVFRKRGIRAIIRKKALNHSGEYTVLICLIPKWQCGKVFAAVNEVKRRLFKVKKRNADLCCTGIRNVLERKEVPYTELL